MATKKEMIGLRFGRLVVLKELGVLGYPYSYHYLCRCDCGQERSVSGKDLRTGHTQSCGCRRWKHGMPEEYYVWANMLQRCNNPRNDAYDCYGGRSIKVCDRWEKSFLAFLQDVGKRPSKNLTLERINNDGNYEPGNCRWTTRQAQQRNRRTNRWVEFQGQKRVVQEWSEILNIPARTLSGWLKKNKDWSMAIQSWRTGRWRKHGGSRTANV